MCIYALIMLVGLGQNPTSVRDAAAIDAAKQVLVQAIDPALPRVSFEAWLRGVVGTEATTKWEVNDCGEQTGDPKQDQGRDFSMCAEVRVDLGGQRELHVSLAVGSFKKGVEGGPKFWAAYVQKAGGSPEWIKGLAAIPSAIRLGVGSNERLPDRRMKPMRRRSASARGSFAVVRHEKRDARYLPALYGPGVALAYVGRCRH